MNRARLLATLILAGLLGASAAPQANAPRVPAAQQKGHPQGAKNPHKMGDWLRDHQNLTLEQQEKLLESDPHFKKLPPERQAQLRERLRKFNSLPPEKRERALQRMEIMDRLTPEQQKTVQNANQQLQALPADRRIMVHRALRNLSQMPPDQRQQILQSDRFHSTFTEQEQTILKNLSEITPPPPAGQPESQSQPKQ